MKSTRLLALCGAVSLGMAAGSAQAKFIIDDFSATAHQASASAGGSDSSTELAASAVGGWRTLEVPDGVPVEGVGNVTLAAVPVASALAFSSDALTRGSARVLWDANGAGLGGVDLTEGGVSPFFSLTVGTLDVGSIAARVEIMDTLGNLAFIEGFANSQNTTIQVSLNDFQQGLGNSADSDFSSVDEISIQVAGDFNSDATLIQVFTDSRIPTPLPGTALLLGLGLGAAGFAARRRS